MAEVTIELLGQMVQRVLDNQHDHSAQFTDLTSRVSQLEQSVAGLHRDNGLAVENTALLASRVDRLTDKLERIERRLDIGDA